LSIFRIITAAAAGFFSVLLGTAVAAGAAWYVIDGPGADKRSLPARWERGMNVTAFLPNAYAEPPANRALLTARAAGTQRVALVPTWYMSSPTANDVFADPAKTPTDASVEAAAAEAKRLGLEVVIKPHVDPQDGSFRGDILPGDTTAWFDSYETMLRQYAELAARVDADGLVIGTELTSMALFPDEWRSLISMVRGIYDGPLTFAANWVDGAEAIEFWDQLDFIGIDAYMPLMTTSEEPTVDELVEAWGPYTSRMNTLAEQWDKRIVFTELGYQSRIGTADRTGDNTGEVSEAAQATAYEAAFEAMRDEEYFDGIWWWEWSAEGLYDPGGWSPENKLAADVLVEWQGPGPPVPDEPETGN
jgi:hypothetical protein